MNLAATPRVLCVRAQPLNWCDSRRIDVLLFIEMFQFDHICYSKFDIFERNLAIFGSFEFVLYA